MQLNERSNVAVRSNLCNSQDDDNNHNDDVVNRCGWRSGTGPFCKIWLPARYYFEAAD